MVRKTVFSGDDVVGAALQVVESGGLENLTARNVAQELGSSTAPVYSNFASMDELALAVRKAVTDELLAFTSRDFTDNAFLNIGIGVLEFARAKPKLYAAIFMNEIGECRAGPRVMASLGERMAALDELADLTEGERLLLLHQMAIFTHGLAVQICTGLAVHFTFADLILFLEVAGDGLVSYALSRPPRTPPELKLMSKLSAFNAMGDEENA